MHCLRHRKGFTLVELLIVVVILGILATLVIPMFTNAAADARESTLESDLALIRSQLEFYKIQHNDTYPPVTDLTTEGTAKNVMTSTTDVTGDTTGTDFGPYLMEMPANPFATAAAVDITNNVVDAANHWYYEPDATTPTPKDFKANDNAAHNAL